jgi:PTH1 family peptidyl-tRNA hydrolase
MKKLIVGLGNPGKKYANSKHNVGFMALDHYATIKKIKFKSSIKFNADIVEYQNVILMKPKTYMNNSGYAVFKLVEYYGIKEENILVIFDDVDLPFAKLRLRYKGGSGGHNGIKSLLSYLSTDEFKRLRVGIEKSDKVELSDYVLSDFSKVEQKILFEELITISSIIDDFKDNFSFEEIMNKYNSRN